MMQLGFLYIIKRMWFAISANGRWAVA